MTIHTEDRGIVFRVRTYYNLALLSSAVIKIKKANNKTTSWAPTTYDSTNGILQYVSSIVADELNTYKGANTGQVKLTFSTGEVYHGAEFPFTIDDVLVPSADASGSVTLANMRLSAKAGTAFVDFSAASVLTSYVDYFLIVTDSASVSIKGYIKTAGTAETLGTEVVTGTLTQYALYKITATEVDHFGTGLTVGEYFVSAGTESCDANNKVQQVTAPAATGVTIVSAAEGTTYNWTTQGSGFDYNDASGYTYEIYETAPLETE